jgi:hypothetical protein
MLCFRRLWILPALIVAAQPLIGQTAPPGVTPPIQFTCSGSFPTDLTVINCKYQQRQRLEQFVTTGLTDQAMVLSVTGSLVSQVLHTPGEWPRTWKYYGYRVGSSYTASVGRATAEYLVGTALHDDPRHVKCSDDPRLFYKEVPDKAFSCTSRQRFVHFLLDSVTVRPSRDGSAVDIDKEKVLTPQDLDDFKRSYRRLPAIDRLVGVYAGAYSQYPWEPRSANTFGAISQRAALSFGSTFLGSFYTEYSASIFSALKKKFSGPAAPPVTATGGAHP